MAKISSLYKPVVGLSQGRKETVALAERYTNASKTQRVVNVGRERDRESEKEYVRNASG